MSEATTDLDAAHRPSRREQLIEVLVFLFLIVPSLVLSFFAVQQGAMSFTLIAVSAIFRDLGLVALVLFFLWRNGEAWRRIGWTFQNGWIEVLLGLALFIPAFFFAGLLGQFLQNIGFSAPEIPLPSFLTASGPAELLLAFVLVVVVAIAEETIFRGYLILRLGNIAGNAVVALVLSAVIFSLGHGYEGSAGVVTVGVLGAVFGAIYLWRRSLVAPMVMHFLQNFIGVVVVGLLNQG